MKDHRPPAFDFTPQEWQNDAACKWSDLNFFPRTEYTSGRRPAETAAVVEVKEVCAGCPVRDKCLTYALEIDERFGIWGGLTSIERRKLTRTRRLGDAS